MTKEKIMAMGAGRELDELLEQHLFGLRRGYRRDGSRCWKDGEGNPVRSEAKPYSTDIKVAWQVVEQLKEDWDFIHLIWDVLAWDIVLEHYEVTNESGKTFYLGKESGATYEQLPEAISKAALLAKLES